MRCLYCGEKLNSGEIDWHNRCIKKFFGANTMPVLDISDEQLSLLAKSAVIQGLTVTGVQKKLSLHLSNDDKSRLTIIDYPTGYILKPQTDNYDSLPEFEYLAMRLAEIVGIQTVPHGLIRMNDGYAYLTKRIDRDIKKNTVALYSMEDFCQLSGRLTQDKYYGSYEGCARIIREFSRHPGLDLSELFLRIAFSFIIGNSDMHFKNFSLIEQAPANRVFTLSKAYDMLPVNIILPADQDQMALTLNGKKRNITKKDFMNFAKNCQIPEASAKNMLAKLCSLEDVFLAQCDDSYLSDEQKTKLKDLIRKRTAILN